jgi:NAD(P)-dependent dehydrogenase (short-subunit alcohol dehydrogenase family)
MTAKKNVLITGASAGFGYGAAKSLAERGHTVYATMRGVSGKNAETANELSAWAREGGYNLRVLELDVTNEGSIADAVGYAMNSGGIDVVINNAGIGNFGIDEGYSVEQAQDLFDVNLFGVMRVNRAVVPAMRESGKGLLMYVTSAVGRLVLPFMSAYVSSKFALEAFAESTSYELQRLGINTVIVQPGAYGTTFFNNILQPTNNVASEYGPTTEVFNGFANAFEEMGRTGQMGDPSEVVQVMVEEVERTSEIRPLRRPVGSDMSQAVATINEVCGQAQETLLTNFGLK